MQHNVATPILFHGPSAEAQASAAARSWGTEVGRFGNVVKGLTADMARDASNALMVSVPGDGNSSIIIGPIDDVSVSGIEDTLLKCLEERDGRVPRPFIWGRDYEMIRPTIRSRCLPQWCPGVLILDGEALRAAKEVVMASLTKDTSSVIESLLTVKDSWSDISEDFLRGMALVLSKQEPSKDTLNLWRNLRPLLSGSNSSIGRVLSCLISDGTQP